MAAQMHLQCPTRTTRDSVVPRCVVGRRACSRHTAHNSRHFGTACVASRHIHHGTRSVTVTSSTMGSAATTPPASDSLPFETEFVLPAGRVVMRIMEPEDEKGAAVVLTRSFATQPGGLPIQDVSQYVQEMRDAPPAGVLLVARLFPNDEDARTRVIATASLSLTADTRERFSTLQPPDAQALLANIAVDPKFRRQGVASRLLSACEAMTKDAGLQELYLHVRLADDAARALYLARGYTQVDKDTMLVSLRGRMPRALMVKGV